MRTPLILRRDTGLTLRIHTLLIMMTLIAAACGGSDASSVTTTAAAVTSTVAISPTSSTTTSTSATTTTVTTSTTTTTTLPPPPPPITIGFAGDTSFTNGLDRNDPFGDITEALTAPDLMVVNLETTIAEPDVGTAFPKRFTFKSPPGAVDLLTAAGIDVVALANNHTLDFGQVALDRTLELVDAGSLGRFGAGPDETVAYEPLRIDMGREVSFVGFSRVPCDWSASGVNSRPGVAWTCPVFEDKALAAVANAATADFTVVMVHWGIEGDHCIQPFQRKLATDWIRAGADLIIGGHPHVLQGIEMIDGAWVVYSMGNFAFPSARGESARTAIFNVHIDEKDVVDLTMTPVIVAAGRPRLAEGEQAQRILSDMTRWSFDVGVDETGRATPMPGSGSACG